MERSTILAVFGIGTLALLISRNANAAAGTEYLTDEYGEPVLDDAGNPVVINDNSDYIAPGGDWGPDPVAIDYGSGYDPFMDEQGDPLNNTTTHLSQEGLSALASEEGFSPTPYADHKGFSIGYGHLIKPGENLTRVTQDEALALLMSDVNWAENAVNAAVQVPLNQNQFDALVIFAFNIGGPAFTNSTMVKLLNAGDYAGAAAQFPRWVYASGAVNNTLVARRGREQDMFTA